MTIPKLIHQMWIGNKKRPVRLMDTWMDRNPSCLYWLWTEENLPNFGFKNTWQIEHTTEFGGKCDIMRYEILHRFGGVFVDSDTECTNALDDFFFEQERFTCFEDEEFRGNPLMEGLVTSSFMGCEPNDPLFELIINEISTMAVIDKAAWIQTGPRMFTDIVNKWKDRYPTKIFPSWYFVPNKPNGPEYSGSDKTYARHYFMNTFNLYEEK